MCFIFLVKYLNILNYSKENQKKSHILTRFKRLSLIKREIVSQVIVD